MKYTVTNKYGESKIIVADNIIDLKQKMKDETNVDVNFDAIVQPLINDEIEAIDGYKKALQQTASFEASGIFSNILEEEVEHLHILKQLQSDMKAGLIKDTKGDK